MRKLLSDPMVPSSPEWRIITPTTLQKHEKYGRESSVSEMRIIMICIVFVSALGVRRQGMGSTKD